MNRFHYSLVIFFIPVVILCTNLLNAEDRTFNGMGNNLFDPIRGAANTPIIRFVYLPEYPGDGSGHTMLTDADRRNPRTISNTVFGQTSSIRSARGLSDHIWVWGQFLDHDLGLASNSNGAAVNGFAPINVLDPQDPLGPNPIPFTRSNFVMGPLGSREQINSVTSFIDASQVYGSSLERATALRTNGGLGAKLEMSANDLMAYNTMGLPNANNGPTPAEQLFVAGDVRANENVLLSSMHTVFVREHNRLVDIIEVQQPGLNAEEQYQLARKIVGAQMQVITYNEFLPALLGSSTAPRIEDYSYSAFLPPDVTQAFAHSAYRFGHSTVTPVMSLVEDDGTIVGGLPMRQGFFNPNFLSNNPHNVELLLMGAAYQFSQEIDTKLVDDLRNFLFGPPGAGGLDLASLNIQRGRDHGINHYNELRRAYGLEPYTSFHEITSDPVLAQQLFDLYEGDIDNVDSYVGGLAEDHLPGGSLGELFTFIITNQFVRLRDGDRLFYLSDDAGLYANQMLKPEIASIIDLDQVTLSQIISWNTGLTNLPDDMFFVPDISGDFDGDGSYTCADVDLLVQSIANGVQNIQFDLNRDEIVDLQDLEQWLAEAGANELVSGNPFLPGDANLDGVVDALDFFAWNANKFTAASGWCAGDFNADGFVDAQDFLIWNTFKFQSAEATAVPEPRAAMLILSLLLGWSFLRPTYFSTVTNRPQP